MKWWQKAGAVMAMVTLAGAVGAQVAGKTGAVPSIYDFTMKNIDGKDVSLSDYKGKVILIVNVASKCGYTPQYEGLEALHTRYKDKGFAVLGFPANDFRQQEPGTDEQIKAFCTTKYRVDFPMFSKIVVTGPEKNPLYKFLTEKETDPEFAGEITWNFNKFLVDRTGKIIARFDSKVTPEDEKIVKAIEAALKS